MATQAQLKKFAGDAVRALDLANLTVVGLAKEIGCHRNNVTRAIRHGKCPRVHGRICTRLNLKPII